MTREQIAEALKLLGSLKQHPRESPANRALIERAHRLFTELTGLLRDALTQELDQFEAALESQDPKLISAASESLDAFMKPYFAGDD
jgi:molecular chaperone HscC